jgi:GNAT superfamily N-acetyltransferase
VLATQVFLDTYAPEGIRPVIAREVLSETSTAAIDALLSRPDVRGIVAERAGHLIGFAIVLSGSTHVDVVARRPAEVLRLYVQRRATGRGVGTLLLDAAERGAAASGNDALWLTAWAGNGRALDFYARRGYRDIGATTFVFEDERFENRLFRKDIASAR